MAEGICLLALLVFSSIVHTKPRKARRLTWIALASPEGRLGSLVTLPSPSNTKQNTSSFSIPYSCSFLLTSSDTLSSTISTCISACAAPAISPLRTKASL